MGCQIRCRYELFNDAHPYPNECPNFDPEFDSRDMAKEAERIAGITSKNKIAAPIDTSLLNPNVPRLNPSVPRFKPDYDSKGSKCW